MRCLQERIAGVKLDGTVDKTHTPHTHTRTHTHTHTHAHAGKGIYSLSLIIFKGNVQ